MPLPFLQRRTRVEFTDAAGAAVRAAQDEAAALGHAEVGAEHFLLGVLAGDDPAARALEERFGVRLEPMRERVGRLRARGDRRRRPLPFDRASRRPIEHASRLGEERGTPVTAGDIVLGILAAGGPAAELLAAHGVGAAALRGALDGAYEPAGAPPPAGRPWAQRLLDAAPPGWELAGLEQAPDEVRAVFRRREA